MIFSVTILNNIDLVLINIWYNFKIYSIQMHLHINFICIIIEMRAMNCCIRFQINCDVCTCTLRVSIPSKNYTQCEWKDWKYSSFTQLSDLYVQMRKFFCRSFMSWIIRTSWNSFELLETSKTWYRTVLWKPNIPCFLYSIRLNRIRGKEFFFHCLFIVLVFCKWYLCRQIS